MPVEGTDYLYKHYTYDGDFWLGVHIDETGVPTVVNYRHWPKDKLKPYEEAEARKRKAPAEKQKPNEPHGGVPTHEGS